jgi:hypothetical protein
VCFEAFAFQGLDTRFSSYEMEKFCLQGVGLGVACHSLRVGVSDWVGPGPSLVGCCGCICRPPETEISLNHS